VKDEYSLEAEGRIVVTRALLVQGSEDEEKTVNGTGVGWYRRMALCSTVG
jgi:hypothetical protein